MCKSHRLNCEAYGGIGGVCGNCEYFNGKGLGPDGHWRSESNEGLNRPSSHNKRKTTDSAKRLTRFSNGNWFLQFSKEAYSMKKLELTSHSVVCWGSACNGNFHAPGWPPAKSILVPASECKCRCLEELRGFFGYHTAANSNMPGPTQD